MTAVTVPAVLRAESLGWSVDGKTILSGVSVEIRPQVMSMIIGLNGSGKTTLLHLLAGLRKPGEGRVWLGKRDLARIGIKERSGMMALLEQNSSAHVELTVRDVVGLGRIPHRGRWRMGKHGGGRDAVIVEEAMATTGVVELSERAWSSLSGGEKQRVQLARALAQEPEILMLDEPTNHLSASPDRPAGASAKSWADDDNRHPRSRPGRRIRRRRHRFGLGSHGGHWTCR